MNILAEKPPNYEDIKKKFPAVNWNTIIVTYYPNIYCMNYVDKFKRVHEAVHLVQQEKYGVEKWWKDYFSNKDFRLSQELEAYGAEVREIKTDFFSLNKKERRQAINQIITDISSAIYGHMITRSEAKRLLK